MVTVTACHITNYHPCTATIDHDTLLYQMVNKKGYVRLHTSFGDLNLELHCDAVPMTCHNFIMLCKQGYYDDTSKDLV